MIWTLATLALTTTVAAAILVGLVRAQLLRRGILDHPNARSSHDTPTPRGGGLGVMAVVLPLWVIVAFIWPDTRGGAVGHAGWLVPLAALALATISWIDDLHSLGALPRLGVQLITAFGGVMLLPSLVFQGLVPPWLDAGLAAISWIWFVNLFNFMDGIDGITGTEAASIGTGILIIGMISVAGVHTLHLQALLIAAAALGFLVWNLPPAKIFLGDVGSVPLGYLIGWLLLALAGNGHWAAALILPLYYLTDATLTLLHRLVRGKKVWQAHRRHFYQQAIQNGRTHGQVSCTVGGINLALVILAVSTTMPAAGVIWSLAAITAALALVLGLLMWMKQPQK